MESGQESVQALVVSEAQRLGALHSAMLVGSFEEGLVDDLAPRLRRADPDELLSHPIPSAPESDLVVLFAHREFTPLQARLLGRLLAASAKKYVIAIRSLGTDIPVPLIELKRGLQVGEQALGYRVYGRRS